MTKLIGFLLVSLGFISGSLVSVLHPVQVKWHIFTGATALGVIGVFLIRSTEHKQKQAAHVITANIDAIETSLTRIVDNIIHLNTQKKEINPYDVRHHIDDLFQADLRSFIEARESIALMYGLQAYADVMSSFATAERYLNRVWSASADGYLDEVHTYLDRACEQFKDSQTKIARLMA